MYKRDFNDHELAAYLRAEGVLDSWKSRTNPDITEYWRGTRLAAVVVYDNASCERVIYTYNDKYLI